MKINIIYQLYTDGDFHIENQEKINCYKLSDYEYSGSKLFTGNNIQDVCIEAQTFLQEFLCEHLRIGSLHYYLLEDFYNIIQSLLDFISNYKSGNVTKCEVLSGNYEGTEFIIIIEEN